MIEWLYLKLFPPKNSEENQEQQKMSFKLTPLDSFSVNFINIDNLNIDISHLQSAIPAIKSTIKQLQNKLDSLNKSQSKYLKSQLTDLNDSHKKNFISDEARTNAIMIHLYNKSLDKLKKRQINFHEQSIHYCNQMIEFVQNTIDNNYPIRIDYNGFIQKVNDYVSPTKNNEIIKMNNLSKALYKMASSSSSKSLWTTTNNFNQTPTAKQVLQTLKSQLPFFDNSSRYMKDGPFDIYFESYITSDQLIMARYNEILHDMSLFEYTKALEDLFEMTKSVSSTFGLAYMDLINKSGNCKASQSEIAEFLIIFYASTRFFFNQVTIQLPYLLTNDLSTSNFLKNCTVIQSMTPRELKAVEHVFLPFQLDKNIKEVFLENKELTKSLDYFQLIPFYNSPLDIAYLANKAINIFNRQIFINIYLNKKCNGDPNGKVPGIKYKSDSDTEIEDSSDFNCDIAIAFDDLFTLFYMAMAISPPPNAPALKVFLHAFGGFQMSQEIDYSSTTIQAAIDFISSMKENI